MKIFRLLTVLFLFFILVSCKNPVEQYGDEVTDAYKRTERFSNEMSLKELQKAIQAFSVSNGRYPETMEELEEFAGIQVSHEQFDYDPNTGIISLRE